MEFDPQMDPRERAKWAAAQGALDFVADGMRIGLGTGSTAAKFVELLGRKAQAEKWQVVCVPTSEATARQARSLGLVLDSAYPDFGSLDVVVDGADEIDPHGNLTKGGGGALLREKYVALASRKMVVIADEGKHVARLGETFRLPVEIVAFAWSQTIERLRPWMEEIELRRTPTGEIFVTDQGNYIVDCRLAPISDPALLQRELKGVTGVVETGIFPAIASLVVTGRPDGSWQIKNFTSPA